MYICSHSIILELDEKHIIYKLLFKQLIEKPILSIINFLYNKFLIFENIK